MEDFKFLTTIDGVFNLINTVDTLTVFYNLHERLIKICYKSIRIIDDETSETEIGEILLKFEYMEFELIFNNIDSPMIKNLIFVRYMDKVGQTLYVDKIY